MSNKYVTVTNLSIFTSIIHWKKSKNCIKAINLSTPMWNEKFELPDGSYYVSVIQDYFEHII